MNKFNEENSLDFIEKLYSDLEKGFFAIGKKYERPEDYIERALRIMNNSKERSRLQNQFEGKKEVYHEDF